MPDATLTDTDTQKPSGNTQTVLLKGEVKIFPSKRLPHLDRREAKAYEAETRNGARAFAMVCQENLIPRGDLSHKYLKAESVSLPRLSAAGVVHWGPEDREKYVFVFENMMGQSILPQNAKRFMGMKADLALGTIIQNLVDALSSLHDRGVAHGNVCLENIYDGGSVNFENAMLGECLSTPAGYAQPVLYETVERAMAHQMAKGNPTYSDDVYALGMCLACLVAPRDFTEEMSSEEIALYKLEYGSFNLVTGRDRLPGSVIEMLRGMLDDDPNARWTLWDVRESLDGRRITGKQKAKSTPKASRPIEFLKKNYFKPDILASQLYKDAAATLNLVESSELYLWLNRSLQSKAYEERFENATEQAKKSNAGGSLADRTVSYVAASLAPSFPIFYKGMSFFPSGFGELLADAVMTRKDINPFVEILQGTIVSFWSKDRMALGYPVGDEISQFDACRMYLLQKNVGFGVERCLYYLSPSLQCLSDKLDGFQVRSPAELLHALEKLSTRKNRPAWFVDRHIIAFLFAHDRSLIEAFSADLNAAEKYRQVSGVLKTFAKIQVRDQAGSLPGLSAWIGEHLGDLINRYHDRERRKLVRREIERLKTKGDLQAIANIFSNFQDLQNDMKMFTFAMRQFQNLRSEYHSLKMELDNNKKFGIETGHQVATMVSGIITGFVVVIYALFLSIG